MKERLGRLTHADVALFGKPPLFQSPKPVGQLAAPNLERYLELVKPAFNERFSSKRVAMRLEERLAAFHGVRHCISVTNAGLGLVILMRLLSLGRRGEVIIPAFSYRGLPHFAQWAGQMPRFCDVDAESHGLDARSVEESITDRTTSILAVNNVTGACDIAGLCEVANRHRIPIFFDSVYGLGSTHAGKMLGCYGAAEVFSLHATKLLNGFEGGYITTNDGALAAEIRAYCASGHVNATLNELHAAMALASLEELDMVIARNEDRYRKYESISIGISGLNLLPYRDEARERYNYEMAIVEISEPWPLTRDETLKLLRAEGAAIAPYYSPPLHRSPHRPAGTDVPVLPVSEQLAERFLQLPVGELMSLEDIDRLGDYLRFVASHGHDIAARMRLEKA